MGHAAERLLASEEAAAGVRPSPGIRVEMLSGFELLCEGERVSLTPSVQRLVAYLALHSRPLLRVHVAGVLWTDSSDERAGASLRSALWRLRRPAHMLISSTSTHLCLNPDVVVDVREAAEYARKLIDKSPDDALVGGDESRLTADLLPDWYEDWVIVERERFRQLRLHALESLCRRLMLAGRFARALETGLAAVAAEPLRESAHRALIRVHLAEGNRGEAVQQYERYRSLLQRELGVEPSSHMRELIGLDDRVTPA
jgi:DNA-binding SARP family transcriptional activator